MAECASHLESARVANTSRLTSSRVLRGFRRGAGAAFADRRRMRVMYVDVRMLYGLDDAFTGYFAIRGLRWNGEPPISAHVAAKPRVI